MNKKDLARHEKALLAEKQRVIKQSHITDNVMDSSGPEASGELSSHRTHVADQGTESYQKEMASRLKSIETDTIREIEDALKRVAKGTYGICDSCGEPISKGRLEIIPHARLCMKCLNKKSGR